MNQVCKVFNKPVFHKTKLKKICIFFYSQTLMYLYYNEQVSYFLEV